MEETYEVKSTKGIEKNMHSEIENLVRKAFDEGYNKGKTDGYKLGKEAGMPTEDEKAELRGEGVLATWEALNEQLERVWGKTNHHDIVGAWIKETLEQCPFEWMGMECECDETGKYVPTLGDIVLDPSGNKCVVLNTDSHVHVLYMDNLKTHKWDKDTKFKKIDEAEMIQIGGELE